MYEGEFKDGLFDGRGTYKVRLNIAFVFDTINNRNASKSASGAVYKGEWRAGRRHGEGEFTTNEQKNVFSVRSR